jgi:hypothetical protein
MDVVNSVKSEQVFGPGVSNTTIKSGQTATDGEGETEESGTAGRASAFVVQAMPLPMGLLPLALVYSLPDCSSLAKPGSNAVEPAPRSLQPGRGGRLKFQHDLLLEEMTEPFRFGCNPFADRGGG